MRSPPEGDGPDRSSSERQLRHAYEQQRSIVDAIGVSSPDFTYLFDTDQRFIYVSPPLLKLWGKTLEEALGKNFEELGYAPELVALHRRQLDEALAGHTVSGSNQYVSPTGIEGHYEYTFVPVFDDDGRVTTIVGTSRDVTARVVADRERTAALERLRESEEQFRQFAEAMPQLAWIAHADGYIHWYNRRWHEYTGTTPEQMEGWGWQSVHDESELPRVLERWKASIATGLPFEMTFPLRRADGVYRWFLTRSAPVRDRHGAIARWLGTNTDIDDQRQMLLQRDAALKAADEAVRFRDEFLTIASHELKTPLAALLLQIERLHRLSTKTPELSPVRPGLEKVRGAGKRLDRLIIELLDISRVAIGQLRLEPESLDLVALAREVCARCEASAVAAGSSLRFSGDAELVGQWDPLRLDQVITNLVDNAIKYGRGQPIDVEVTRHGDLARVRVSDRGIGIATTERERVFERFARGVSTRQYGGFGLGLWIVREIVAASGGRIEIGGEAGAGAVLTVTLPIQ